MGKIFLLTGAGFTHEFGGFLAKQMWSEIFNHREIKKHQLAHIMTTDFDYESIYYKIHGDPKYRDEEKKAIDMAIWDAYLSLDTKIKGAERNNSQQLIHPVNKMIEKFSVELGGGGFFFTLNQDIYVERYFGSSNTRLHHPYIDNNPPNNRLWSMKDKDFISDYCIKAPAKPLEHPESLRATKFHYVKLHGSFNWKRSDGTELMVIGQDKEGRIAEEPLLSIYFDIFKSELRQEGVRLLVIGYGLTDKHINAVVKDCLRNYGLKLAIVAPWQPACFMQKLNVLSDNRPSEISKNCHICDKELSNLFLPNDDEWKKICDFLYL